MKSFQQILERFVPAGAAYASGLLDENRRTVRLIGMVKVAVMDYVAAASHSRGVTSESPVELSSREE